MELLERLERLDPGKSAALNDWNIYHMWNTWNLETFGTASISSLITNQKGACAVFFLARSLSLYHTYAESVCRDDNDLNKIPN